MLVPLVGGGAADDMTGRASVIDGDTLEIHGTRIRLWGIDAPESSQLCRGNDSMPYRCGAKAANDLDAFHRGPAGQLLTDQPGPLRPHRDDTAMCNLYSITTNQAAIAALFRVVNRYAGNLSPIPGVLPDYPAPVVRNAGADRELTMVRWGCRLLRAPADFR